jgi:hypothetical protein
VRDCTHVPITDLGNSRHDIYLYSEPRVMMKDCQKSSMHWEFHPGPSILSWKVLRYIKFTRSSLRCNESPVRCLMVHSRVDVHSGHIPSSMNHGASPCFAYSLVPRCETGCSEAGRPGAGLSSGVMITRCGFAKRSRDSLCEVPLCGGGGLFT